MGGVCLVAGLGACGSQEEPVAPADTPAAAASAVQAQAVEEAAKAQQQADASLAGLSVEQLRTEANKAYQESRLYSPVGESAMEYYLALRDKEAGDAAASSALIDLLPMTVIATEQSRDRGDFAEARRLLGLIERADAAHPAVERLRASIVAAEEENARRAEEQKLTAEQETQRQEQLERERAQQQQQAQATAAQALAQQQAAEQEANREAAARAETARQEAARQQAAAPPPAAAAPTPAAPAAATPAQLRPVNTPAPRYPPEALRAGTSGEVQVEFTVGVDGSVTNARVVRADPPRTFDREALNAVRRWRFEPVPAPVTTRRSIGFSPSGN
nr:MULTISPECIES: energy transducer TonB [Luteimonas]